MIEETMDQPQKIVPTSVRVIDQQRLQSAIAKVHKVNHDGCIIELVGNGEMSDQIGLQFDTLDQLISGRVVWRKDRVAGVTFEWEESVRSDNRTEHRINVSIPAIICNRERTWQTNGVIRNASRSGCRIESEDCDELPKHILIKIDTVDTLIKGEIVRYDDNFIGVRLDWNCSDEIPDAFKG